MNRNQNLREFLPQDGFAGTLIGRAWIPTAVSGKTAGPSPVWLTESGVLELSSIAPTCAELLDNGFSTKGVDASKLANVGSYDAIMANTLASKRDANLPYFLSPVDLQAIKACGVKIGRAHV